MNHEKRNSKSGDIMCGSRQQDVSQADDDRMPRCDVAFHNCFVRYQVKYNVHLSQIRVLGQVEIAYKMRVRR